MFELAATNSIARLTILLVVFGSVVISAFALMTLVSRRSAIRGGLRALGGDRLLVPGGAETLRTSNDTAWSKLADAIERAGLNLADSKSDKLRAKLVAAGFRSPAAPRLYTLVRLVLVFALPAGYVLLGRHHM